MGPASAPSDDEPRIVPPKVTASIANFGDYGVAMTAAAVHDVLAQRGPFSLKLMVIDDGSGPEVVERLRRTVPASVEVVALATNGGYATACNAAIRRAAADGSDRVWLLNNDLGLPPTTLLSLLEALESNPTWAAVAPATVSASVPDRVLGAGATLNLTRARVRHLYQGRSVRDLPSHPYQVQAVEGAAPLLRLQAVDSVGLFDEGYGMYWEDTDWSVRARRRGWMLGVDPRARVEHRVSQSTSSEQRTEWMITNRIRISDKLGSPTQRFVFRLYFLLGWLPLYTVARLLPQYGVRTTFHLLGRLVRRSLRAASQSGTSR